MWPFLPWASSHMGRIQVVLGPWVPHMVGPRKSTEWRKLIAKIYLKEAFEKLTQAWIDRQGFHKFRGGIKRVLKPPFVFASQSPQEHMGSFKRYAN